MKAHCEKGVLTCYHNVYAYYNDSVCSVLFSRLQSLIWRRKEMYWMNKESKLLIIRKTARKTGGSSQKVLKVCLYSEQPD